MTKHARLEYYERNEAIWRIRSGFYASMKWLHRYELWGKTFEKQLTQPQTSEGAQS